VQRQLFTALHKYTKWARAAAILWTLLIFIACLWPGKDIPKVSVPFADKWVHFVLFGVFSFLWLCSYPGKGLGFAVIILLFSVFTGCLVEELQGALPALGRTKDVLDVLADSVGGMLGVAAFRVLVYVGIKQAHTKK
jgi:VanZ family protein